MPQHIVPLIFLLGALVVTLSAARAALKTTPDHPLVKLHSPAAAKAFGLASVLYLGSIALLWLNLPIWSLTCGFGALFSTVTGSTWAGKRQDTHPN